MEPFATAEDYETRYGQVDDTARLSALLEDASALLAAEWRRKYGSDYKEGVNSSFDANAKAVCCAVVNQAIGVPDAFAGASQYTQTAGSYSASVTLANPSGDMYLGKAARRRLGLSGGGGRNLSPAYGAPI